VLDPETFLIQLYVMVDDFSQSHLPPEVQPGPSPSLARSEVLTLALLGQWRRFASEREFYAWIHRDLGSAFPRLPHRSQLNRLIRRQHPALMTFAGYLARLLNSKPPAYEVLDGSGVATRNAKRRGGGWLFGRANIGWCNRIGWYEGFHLIVSVTPAGVVTGFGFAPASTKDQPLAETFLWLRAHPDPRLPSVGEPAVHAYVADKGYGGRPNHQRWRQAYGATVVCPPQRASKQDPHPWPKAWRRWLAHHRQIVESVYAKLHQTFRLDRERPHDLVGFGARVAAKVGLHNFCIWLNQQLGRPSLAFTDLIDW
jgi:hypothetical protein